MLRADPVRRFLVTASAIVLLPTLLLAWTAGNLVARRVTEHVAQAGSAEVAANAAAVMRQSGLAASSSGHAVVVFSVPERVPSAWQYFETVARRNPNTRGVQVYDAGGRLVFGRSGEGSGGRAGRDAALQAALEGERATRLLTEGAPLAQLAGTESAQSYSVLIPLVLRSGEPAGVLEVTQDLGPIAADMAVARWMIVLIVAGLCVVVVVLTAVFASRLARRSFFDPVTSLPNLNYLRSAARSVLDAAARNGQGGGLVLIDVDRFKLVNEALGRARGDTLLRDLADRLRASVRGSDYLARLGSDDFAVLVPATDEAALRTAAERAVAAIATPFRTNGRELRLEANAGVALFPRDGAELDGLLQRAEQALERAKRTRRAVAFYRRESDAGRHSLYLESDLRAAIERGELSVVYQPICYLATGEILGCEALARWQHPTRGPISPTTFVELAERGGFVDGLDRWTLRQATARLAAWSRAGSNVLVSVNMAAQTLSDPTLPAYIESLLAETGAPPELLVLEVTERTALDDFESSAGVLRSLRETGVGIALDDFGRGYSSLATLDRLPISFLKLDASFTRGIGSSLKDEYLLRAVKLFTKGIGIPFVAEGIETESQRTWLIQQGVRFGQGHLFSRPTSCENITPPRNSRASARLLPPLPSDNPRTPN